mmetsp:Transcript_1202/g.3526  ORF Transcript_1202/g.3526 Transcript_1202/m.3526 type:complete len:212 (+) Transcript_1202:2314-2949(+)
MTSLSLSRCRAIPGQKQSILLTFVGIQTSSPAHSPPACSVSNFVFTCLLCLPLRFPCDCIPNAAEMNGASSMLFSSARNLKRESLSESISLRGENKNSPNGMNGQISGVSDIRLRPRLLRHSEATPSCFEERLMFSGLEIIFHAAKGHARSLALISESSLVMFERPGTGSEKLIPSLSRENLISYGLISRCPIHRACGTDTARPSNSIRLT